MSKTFKASALILFVAAILCSFSSLAWPQPAEQILTIETGIHSSMIRDMVTDAQQRILVTGSNDKTVRIWSSLLASC